MPLLFFWYGAEQAWIDDAEQRVSPPAPRPPCRDMLDHFAGKMARGVVAVVVPRRVGPIRRAGDRLALRET